MPIRNLNAGQPMDYAYFQSIAEAINNLESGTYVQSSLVDSVTNGVASNRRVLTSKSIICSGIVSVNNTATTAANTLVSGYFDFPEAGFIGTPVVTITPQHASGSAPKDIPVMITSVNSTRVNFNVLFVETNISRVTLNIIAVGFGATANQ